MGEKEGRGCYVCHNLRKPLLCPSCLHKGVLGDTAHKAAQQRKQKLLDKLNRSLEAQVSLPSPRPREGLVNTARMSLSQANLACLQVSAVSIFCAETLMLRTA